MSFIRVARLRSISAAASELGYVPSAVSQHISALERALGGTPIFIRNPGAQLQLTAAGRTLFEHASNLLTAATVFTDGARTLSMGTGIEIRVGSYGSALSHLLIPAMQTMRAEGRPTPLRAIEAEPADGLTLVEQGELDVLIAHRYLPEDRLRHSSRLRVRTLGIEPVQIAVSAGLPEPQRTLQHCLDSGWVAGGPQFADRRLLERWCASLGTEPRIAFETDDFHIGVEAVAAGLAVGLIPATVVNGIGNAERLAVVPVASPSVPLSREVIALIRTDAVITEIDEFLDELERGIAATNALG
ncbi:LysR family transcriptional regulator [Mycolicibacterium madagascariense]|uniref:LysR family transcriptional regulator n=1 Tax=Mycolicibacterium madagascariense TaxID=212765 RepID=UPI0013D78536|nr:LysR family transcriptional regulator [Mycolicibacterium madagascariense]MCV7010879.1 LysR family transcriptional regulator [Mycolicibacterium madagascariense]